MKHDVTFCLNLEQCL